MSGQIRYAYLKGQTWLYRRNYPKEVAALLGQQALKQSLKTGDVKIARQRAAEVNARYEETVSMALSGAMSLPQGSEKVSELAREWTTSSDLALIRLREALRRSEASSYQRSTPTVNSVQKAARAYLLIRQKELRPGGFKSVRYSLELFQSKYGQKTLGQLTRSEGREFLSMIGKLSPLCGRSPATRGRSLDKLVEWSAQKKEAISARTQRRIWSQVNHWLDWCVYEGELEANPFQSVRLDSKVRGNPYAVPTQDEVKKLLSANDPLIGTVMLVCLLSGMRAGEATGLLREDILNKGNLGLFFHVRPNRLRLLKTEAAERIVPMHPNLADLLPQLPQQGPLFPSVSVPIVTKRFSKLRKELEMKRTGLVFHSTRKWFITQCERTGVPEHFTASLVGHKSARSENGITYGIYSAGISEEQKRNIVDQIRLPGDVLP